MVGKSAMVGYLSGAAGASVTGGLNAMITDTSLFGFSSSHIDNVRNLTSTMGGLASTGVTYGMTGNATVNLLNSSMFGGPSVGLFEMSFGNDGLRGAIGMEGTDLNLGKLSGSVSGINVLYQNHRISNYAQQNKLNAQVAMRALYSYGDKTGRGTYSDLLNGEARLAVDKDLEGEAKTESGADGVRTIILKTLGDDPAAMLRAGIALQHESYRDGILGYDQNGETLDAASGHTEMAIRMLKDGRYAGAVMSSQNLLNDIKSYSQGAEAFSRYVVGSYDSSQDFWLNKLDGTLVDNGSSNLDVEYRDPVTGEIKVKKNVIESETGSVSQSLIQYLGMDRAAQLLGVNPANMGNYDEQTIHDVLGMDPEMVARLSVNGQMSFNDLSLDQQQKLMGELLLKQGADQTWDAENGWHGASEEDIATFKLSDDWDGYTVGFDGTMTNGEYDKFVVDIVHDRDAMSYFGSIGDQALKEKFNGLDSSVYFKKDLDGNVISTFSVDGVQTVDNLWSENFDQTTANYSIFGNIQGNTLTPGESFFSTYGMDSGSFPSDVLVSAYAQTFSGINVDSSGYDPDNKEGGRWLTHQYSPAINPWLSSDGCIVNTDENQLYINNTLNSWNLYSGFNMGTVINEDWSNFYRSLYAYY
jgi:hypothetical protein